MTSQGNISGIERKQRTGTAGPTGPAGADGAGGVWGQIIGNLTDQPDLVAALNLLQPLDDDLTALAGLASGAPVANLAVVRDAAGTGFTLVAAATASGYPEGTAFPTIPAPVANQKFYRTDLDMLCVYDGTRWLTTQLFAAEYSNASAISTTPVTVARFPAHPDFQLYLVKLSVTAFVATTNSGTIYWTFQTSWSNAANVVTSIGAALNTSAAAPNTWGRYDQAINAPADATTRNINVTAAKVSTPGTLLYNSTLYYRLIIP